MRSQKASYQLYPSCVGLLLGLLQTGLFLQLTFTLSSSFRTYLLVTLCWLLGSAVGVTVGSKHQLQLSQSLLLALLAFFTCTLLLFLKPFYMQLWIVYAGLIVMIGFYPGLFYNRMSTIYRANALFFQENNGFILGLVAGTLSFMIVGRPAIWGGIVLIAGLLALLGEPTQPAD